MVATLTSLLLLAAPARTPVLVELFSSEGCSSCPSADAALSSLAESQPIDAVEVIPLAFHVDYWDYLGWSDPYAQPLFVARQEAYARRGGDVYTPQMVVDGDQSFVGSKSAALEAVLARGRAPHEKVSLEAQLKGGVLSAKASADGPGTVWLAVTESGLDSKVKRGENAGRALHHDAVVRKLVKGGALELKLPPGWRADQLAVVAFVQDPEPDGAPGPVRGAARVVPVATGR